MARSKVTTPKGKKVSAKKKRDTKAKASVHIERVKPSSERTKTIRINDGDGTVYLEDYGAYRSKKAARPNAVRRKTTGKERSMEANRQRAYKKYPQNK